MKPLQGKVAIVTGASSPVGIGAAVARRLPDAHEWLAGHQVNVAVNGEMILAGEAVAPVRSGDRVALVPAIAGG